MQTFPIICVKILDFIIFITFVIVELFIFDLLCPQIFSQLQSRTDSCLVALAIACYLVQEGCSLTKRNHRGVSPLDLVADTPIAEILQQYNLQTHIPPQIAAPLKRQKR